MDNTQITGQPIMAFIYASASVICGIFTAFAEHVELYVRVIAGLAAIVAAIFAVRYHYYATLEKKEIIKQIKDGNRP